MDQANLAAIQEFTQTEPMRQLRKLLGDRLEDYRQKNDSAEGKDVIANQGAIRELKYLLKFLNPARDKKRTQVQNYDGAFN